ncbi:MAG: acyltransferase [Turicibacter sp.]
MKIVLQEKSSPDEYLNHLRCLGCKIGEGTSIFASPRNVFIDDTRPWLIDIGNNVQITRNVTILTHGYDWAVIKGVYGDVLGSAGKVKIGNNVFIGMGTTILKGTTIGDNVIIGANSLVNGNFPSNCVIAGNPARIVSTLEDYYVKRKNNQYEEAKEVAIEYFRRYGELPPKDIFDEFFWLFENRDEIREYKFINKMNLCGNYEESLIKYKETEPLFEDYNDFLQKCGLK